MILAELEMPPISHLFEWRELFFKGTPFAINKTALLCIAATAICSAVFIAGGRKRALVPTGVQNFVEAGYAIVEEQIAVQVMGEEGKKWAPFLSAIFFWILTLNLIGLIPGIQFPAGSRIAIPLFLALQTYVVMVVMGFKHQGPLYILKAIFPPGVPKPLYILVTPIELVSKFIVRPASLTIRLFANLMAGHMLLTVFALMSAALWNASYWKLMIPLPMAMSIAMTGFEFLVALLQAYIFAMLSAVYIGESIHPDH